MRDGVMLDTSFLIRLLNGKDSLHSAARDYFRYCMENDVAMFVSVIAIAEFCVRGKFSDLPLRNVIPIGFNIDHSIRAGKMMNSVYEEKKKRGATIQQRAIIPNDTKMFSQADVDDRISYFLSSDSEAEKVYDLMKEREHPRFHFIDIGKISYKQAFNTLF